MRHTIYDKNGNERVVQWSADVCENVGECAEPQLEYHGTWMGECFVTLTVKCAVPVDFHIGDYIVYRGEKFVINYDPTVVKRARRGTYGEGFTYDNIKFNALHNELTEVMFLDYVLGDNGLHYTSLPVFPFFAATIDDFCDRLQANTNRYCEKNGIAADDKWLFLTPALDRTIQRALSCGMSEAEAIRRWEEAYGSGTSTDEIKTDVSVSISNQTIWNAMTMIKNSFGLNFINRGRSVIIGSAGLPTNHIFEYGKGNGLYEIERVADSEQQIVTKMYAYGNETNLPVRYYANIGVRCYARPTRMTFGSLTYYFLDMAWNEKLYCVEESYAGIDGYRVVVSNASGQTSVAYVADPSGLSNISDGTKLDDLTVIVFANSDFNVPLNGQELNFDNGINKDQWPASRREYPENLPNNMAVNRLMLPGFPFKSLYEWVKENGGTNCDDATGKATWHGYTAYFSKDKYQPYVQSLNSDELGIREYAKTFDGSNGDEDIFPTIEGTGFDTIQSAEKIDDNGIFAEGDDAPTVTLTLPSFGAYFDLKEQAGLGDSPAIVMKDGYCGGRSFSFEAANVTKNNNGTFTVKCKREHDDLLDLWFPYSYNKSKGQPSSADEPYQVCAGDKYMLTGIPMTDTYVEANAVKLLEASLLWLSKNDYTRHTYLPKVDEIYMARQHDEYKRGETARSLYLTIKEGDLLRFMDEDLHIGDSMIFIDSLTIKEYGNAQIPTYDITLRNDKEVGTIERMQEQINSLTTGTSTKSSGSGGGGMTTNQLNELIEGTGEKLFLSKLKDDVANGLITFVKGLVSKARALFEGDVDIQGLLRGSRAQLNTIKSDDFTGDGMADTGWKITNAYNGHSKMTIDELYVRMKAIFESLEVKERKVSGGDLTFTGAANVILRTDYLNGNKQILGYDTVKVPWFLENGADFFMTNRQMLDMFSREARIKRSFDVLDDGVKLQIRYVRCYFLAEDGDGNEVYNMWQVGDLIRCQTFNMQKQEREGGVNGRDIPSEDGEHSYSRQQNTFWWRKCVAVDSEPTIIDGRKYHWFDVAYNLYEESRATGNLGHCALGSDIPCAGDNACQFGNTSNPERMNAISIEINGAGNSDAPAIKMYRGIYTFDLKKCWWGGETTRKGMWSPSAGFEVYAPLFKFVTEYGNYREPINRGSWQSIPRQQDDYGNSVQYEGDDEPMQMVRKCYYYNQVSHKGSVWLCTMANDDFHWVDAYGRYISESDYNALSEEQKAQCSHVQNYTTDEPSSDSPNWTLQVSKGDPGAFKSSVFCRTNTTPAAPSNEKRGGYNTYTHPVPPPVSGQPTWTDGVSDGSAKLWMSTAWFYSDGTHDDWTTPQPQTDTQTQDIEFCPLADYTPIPDNSPIDADRRNIGWYDPERDKNRLPSGTTWEDMIWRAERKKSNGEYAGAWVYSRIKGENAVRIDLTNENDSMLYTSGGTLVSGNVTSVATLFDGATDVSDKTTWTITANGCTVSSGNSRNIVVTGMTNTTGYVSVKAEYTDKGGTKHTVTTRLNIKKIVDGDKYDLDISPNAIAYNITKDDPAATTLTIRVWKTSINSSGGVSRTLSAPPSGYYVYANGTRLTASATGTYSYTTDNSQISDITVKIASSASATDFLDLETIPVNKAEDGEKGQSSFTSHVFMRSASNPNTPTGGSYTSPVPSGWEDGVPDGTLPVWMSTRIFSSDGKAPQQTAWTTPRQMTDTANFDVEFSSVANPNPPAGHPNTNTQWSNNSDSSTIWMATSECHNGVWSDWQVVKIKGEKGDSIKGDATPVLLFSKNPIVFQGSAFGQSVNTTAISSQVVVLAGNSGYTPTNLVLSDIPSGVNVSKSGTTISVSPKNIGVAESALVGSVKVTATYDDGKTAVGYLTLAVSRQGSVKYIAVKGECWHGTAVPQGSFEICSGISENTYNTQGRGLTLLVVRKSDLSIAYGPVSFDTYGDDGSGYVACNNLATTIRGYNEDYFICLASMDAIGWSDNLIEALIEYGSNGVEVTTRGRYPFVFVGYKGLSRGYAIQKQGVLEGNAVEAVAYISGEKLTSTRNGEIGRNFWYAGVYDASKTYEVTQNAAPFVSYGGNYYVRIGDGLKTTGKTPGPDSTYWELMTSQFNYLITQAIFSTYAQLGSWVFNSDYMFSAKDASGNSRGSQDYTGMTDDKKTSGFIPAVAMDAANGRASFSGDKVRFNPKGSGWLANQNIKWNENGDASFKGSLDAATGTFKGKLDAATGTFTGSVVSNDNKVVLTKSENAFGLGYTWTGFATTKNGVESGDLATIGARLGDEGYDYGRIALVKCATGTSTEIDNNTSIFLSAMDGSIEAAAYKIKRWGSWAKGNLILEDTEENRRYQLLIYTGADVDGSLTLKTNPKHGTVLIVKRQRNSGWLIIYNAKGEEIGDMSVGGVMMCVYNGVDHKWQ